MTSGGPHDGSFDVDGGGSEKGGGGFVSPPVNVFNGVSTYFAVGDGLVPTERASLQSNTQKYHFLEGHSAEQRHCARKRRCESEIMAAPT